MKLIATIISRVFEPFVMFSVVTFAAAVTSGLTPEATRSFILLLIFMVGIPIALLTWAVRMKKVDNWDVSRREQRIIPMVVLICLAILYLPAVAHFGNNKLTQVFNLYFIWLLGFFAITLKEKISGHTSANALAASLLVYIYGWSVWPVLLIVPLVGWARIVRRDHTVFEVVLGALYSFIVIAFWFRNIPYIAL